MMPLEVLEQAQAELLDWQHTGMSVAEVSHRSKEFVACADHTQELLRQIHSRDAFLGGLPTLRDGRGRAGPCKKNAQILNIVWTDAVYYLTWI